MPMGDGESLLVLSSCSVDRMGLMGFLSSSVGSDITLMSSPMSSPTGELLKGKTGDSL